MKKLLLMSAAASLLATAAFAQTTVTTTTGTAGGAVQIEPQYRTKIKSYVTEHKIRPVTTKEKIVVGGRVPADVELESVPGDWGPSLTNIATCIRVTASCWSIRVVGPSFRKSNEVSRARRGPLRASLFVPRVSSVRNGRTWYNRCNRANHYMNCVLINYPAAEERQWDAVVTRISLSLAN